MCVCVLRVLFVLSIQIRTSKNLYTPGLFLESHSVVYNTFTEYIYIFSFLGGYLFFVCYDIIFDNTLSATAFSGHFPSKAVVNFLILLLLYITLFPDRFMIERTRRNGDPKQETNWRSILFCFLLNKVGMVGNHRYIMSILPQK